MKANRRQLRDALDPFDIPEERFRELYRLPRSLAMDLMQELSNVMTENVTPDIPLSIQLCSTLNFFASGSYQRRVGQDAFACLSQSCVSRCIKSISKTIALKMSDKYIVFPTTPEEIESLVEGFQKLADFPGVFALVGGTRIALAALNKKIEFSYVCRKGFHSINTQVIVDSNMRFLNVNARYPGSAHDSSIWRNSLASSLLGNMYNQMGSKWKYFLLADTGYPLEPWLLKPYASPRTSAEKEFNVRLRSLRSLIERAIGLLKARFRCLLKEREL
ncbi:putative nuclease HARBI1, partial [Pseudolycoriella hygida]